jgi:hypothetical protein
MRRTIYAVLILMTLVFSLGSALAISTSINDSYSPGETIITQISGNILSPITTGNVELKREGHIGVAFESDVKKLGENYYLWVLAPTLLGNYTLIIKDITTTISGKIQEISYEKNFSISGNLTDYSVKPGFISTNKSFQIKVQLNEDYNKQIDINFLKETNFTLKPGENTLDFSISEINESGLFNLSIGKYNPPVYVQVNKPISISTGGNATGNATEIINLTNLTITRNVTSAEEEAINKERLKYNCSQYPGTICKADETCSGESIFSNDSTDKRCCVNGKCASKTPGRGSSAWIGYLIAAIVIIAGVFIWIRYKKIKAEKNPIKRVLSAERKTP